MLEIQIYGEKNLSLYASYPVTYILCIDKLIQNSCISTVSAIWQSLLYFWAFILESYFSILQIPNNIQQKAVDKIDKSWLIIKTRINRSNNNNNKTDIIFRLS